MAWYGIGRQARHGTVLPARVHHHVDDPRRVCNFCLSVALWRGSHLHRGAHAAFATLHESDLYRPPTPTVAQPAGLSPQSFALNTYVAALDGRRPVCLTPSPYPLNPATRFSPRRTLPPGLIANPSNKPIRLQYSQCLKTNSIDTSLFLSTAPYRPIPFVLTSAPSSSAPCDTANAPCPHATILTTLRCKVNIVSTHEPWTPQGFVNPFNS